MKRFLQATTALMLLCPLLVGCHSQDSAGGATKTGQESKTSGSDKASNGADTSGKGGGESKDGGSGGANGGSGSDKSSAGMPVDTVKIEPADQGKAGIRIAPVEVRRVPQQLIASGQVAMDERHTNHIGARADGVVERVMVLPGDMVRSGQTLAWLHSHTVHETVGALAQAYAAVDRQSSAVKFAEANRDRYQHLLSLQVASQEEAQRAGQELKQAQQGLADADANVHMEREHLSELLQVSPSTLTPQTIYQRELVPIRAEYSGNVIQRDITPGQVLLTGQQAFVVSNLSTVWVMAAVNEKDLPQVHRGQDATVTTQGLHEVEMHGVVGMLGDQVDPQTRTVPVRITVSNPGTRLRPGMFATANINLSATTEGVYVPESALQDVNGLQAVFVTADNTHFTVRAVTLGEHSRGMVQVIKGLSPQDHVVVDGAFMVKGELLKGSVGEG
ncbi:efflux RND transporter periplasmic adaptor subunit [Terriglobus sp.]|uniref:efflux RND transporter periplasmic adaptor subunit n=1 Tax=Terriglobus sp. TaxID=1889013 RepID=UPI003B0049B6